MFVIEYYHQ